VGVLLAREIDEWEALLAREIDERESA